MGDRLLELRTHYGIGQAELAALIKIDRLTVSNIERGVTKKFQKYDTINKIVSIFGTSKEWLEEGKGEMLPEGDKQLKPYSEVTEESGSWKDEAWEMAKSQINKKDETIDRLSVAFDRLTEILSRADVNFLAPVKETA